MRELKLLSRNRFHRFFAETDGKRKRISAAGSARVLPLSSKYNPLIGR
jgi:hypothetical protein